MSPNLGIYRSMHCEFNDQLEKMLRDRLVCGVNDERIKRRLLAESQLEFKKAMELATAMETADRNTRDLKHANARNLNEKPKELQVNRVTKEPPKQKQPPRNPRQSKECYRCGGQFHDAEKCRYKEEECYRCHKKGHKANTCRSKRKTSFQNSNKFGNTHRLETSEEAEEECEE